MPKIDVGNLIIWFIVLLFSLSFHEAAHAWTSERFGDDTGRLQGRITLNPMAHIDPIGTILFPILSFITSVPLLGWAKPVQTNPLRWREKTKANIAVSAAGPISNFILATITLIIIKTLILAGVLQPYGGYFEIVIPAGAQPAFVQPLAVLLSVMLILNVSLGVFNLIPIPPLDGSHVLEEILPYNMASTYEQLRPYGFMLLMVFMWIGLFRFIFTPVYVGVMLLVMAGN